MKRVLLIVAIGLPAVSQLSAMEITTANPRHQCSQICIKGCPIVKSKQSLMVEELKVKLQWGNSRGNPCKDVETEGLETLFIEKEATPAVSQKKVFKICGDNALVKVSAQEKEETNITVTETPKQKSTPPGFLACTKAVNTLVMSGSSEVKKLLNTETEASAFNNLDAIFRSLETKNNDFTELLRTATSLEKENNDYMRLDDNVGELIELGKARAQREPFSTFLEDISHPYSSYMSEIRLLQRRLHPPSTK